MRVTRFFVAAMMLVALSGCNDGGDPRGDPDPTPSVTPTSSTTPSDPPWMAKYSEPELEAYEAALLRWEQYEKRAAPIWEAGKATPEAKRLFRQFFYAWPTMYERLESYERSKVRIEGLPEVLWSRARRVQVADGTGAVTIDQCIDPTTVVVLQDGEPASGSLKDPFLRTIRLSRPTGHAYLISEVLGAEQKKVRTCRG